MVFNKLNGQLNTYMILYPFLTGYYKKFVKLGLKNGKMKM
jgi:hypothetical protein